MPAVMGLHGLLLLGVLACIVLLVPGYALWLRIGARGRHAPGSAAPCAWPAIDVVVPVWNEAAGIEAKLANLAALELPDSGVTFWVVDGNSDDDTAEIVERLARGEPRIRLLRLDRADKTAQLNAALERARGDWVVVSDADAELPPETLRSLFAAAAGDPSLAVVGTVVAPLRAHPLEARYWTSANHMRRLESRRGCASIVTGPCYAFRRDLLDRLPDDVVADDVHVALEAAVRGGRVGFVETKVLELRSPLRLAALFRHKRRKADAYLREVLRFLPRAPRMDPPARGIFLWRATQLIGFPLLVTAGAVIAVHGAVTAAPDAATAAAALAVPPALAVSGRVAGGRRDGPFAALQLGVLLAAVQMTALLLHPFSRQSARFERLP
jgi:hypothetical protein